jgi:hypothetical protein
MVGEWGRENALAALALLEKQNAQLRTELERVREVHRAEQRRSADRLRECLESK